MHNRYLFGVFITALSAIFWGLSGVSSQYLFVKKGIDPNYLVTVRLFFAGICIFIPIFMRQKLNLFKIFLDKKSILPLIIFSIVGLMFCQYTYYVAINLSNAAVATAIQYTAPVIIILYVCLKYKKMPNMVEIIALIFALGGVFFLSTHGDFYSFVIPPKAVIIALVSAVCVAVYSVLPIRINQKYGTLSVLGIALMIAGVFAFFYTRFWEFDGIKDFESFMAVLVIVFLGTIAAFWLYLYGVGIIGPSRASLIASIEPVSAAIFGYIWLGTKFTFFDYVGFFMIISCTFILAKLKK